MRMGIGADDNDSVGAVDVDWFVLGVTEGVDVRRLTGVVVTFTDSTGVVVGVLQAAKQNTRQTIKQSRYFMRFILALLREIMELTVQTSEVGA